MYDQNIHLYKCPPTSSFVCSLKPLLNVLPFSFPFPADGSCSPIQTVGGNLRIYMLLHGNGRKETKVKLPGQVLTTQFNIYWTTAPIWYPRTRTFDMRSSTEREIWRRCQRDIEKCAPRVHMKLRLSPSIRKLPVYMTQNLAFSKRGTVRVFKGSNKRRLRAFKS